MSVSSIAAGTIAAPDNARNAINQRIEARQPEPASDPQVQGELKTDAKANSKTETTKESSSAAQVLPGLAAPTPHANRVGVAAYVSIMNPARPVSMRTEA